jgi:hypothetical protein
MNGFSFSRLRPKLFFTAFTTLLTTGLGTVISRIQHGGDEFRDVPDDGVIRKPGMYCLDRDIIVKRETGIWIKAGGVQLDLQGHTVRFDSDTPGPNSVGIDVSKKARISIKNGKISGWRLGVEAFEVEDLILSGLEISDIGYIGVNSLKSKNLDVSKNRFSGFRRDVPRQDPYIIGLNIRTRGCQITDNVFEDRFGNFSELENKVETVHILIGAGEKGATRDCFIVRNRLSVDRLSPKTYGVWVGMNADAVIQDNILRNHFFAVVIDRHAQVDMTSNKMSLDKPGSEYSSLLGENASLNNVGVHSLSSKIKLFKNEIINYSRPIYLDDGGVSVENKIEQKEK